MLIVTRLVGPQDSDQTEQSNPNWTDIETAIRCLDGDTCTLVTIEIGSPPVPHMSIGGGAEGKYLVYSTVDNITFRKLVNSSARPGKCVLVAGGQRGRYDQQLCVSLTEALRAAKTYAESGGCDPGLTWA